MSAKVSHCYWEVDSMLLTHRKLASDVSGGAVKHRLQHLTEPTPSTVTEDQLNWHPPSTATENQLVENIRLGAACKSIQEASICDMAPKQRLVEIRADFEQTIVNKAIDQWSKQIFVTTLWTLAVYDISHCVDRSVKTVRNSIVKLAR